jgi:hypothetical protein
MSELTIRNIEMISEDVSRSGITFSHLCDELIDHICCKVENDMQQGLSFEEAYERTKDMIGNKGLKKIQEDTLMLIDKKYRLMKKTMKIFGVVSMSLMTMGALFKIQHWPGAGIMLVLGFLLLGTVFFPSALWVMKKESRLKGSLFIYITAIIGGIALIFGFLFKVQHYPGAGIMLLMAYLIICFFLIPAILISILRDEKSKNLHVAYTIGAISLIIYLLGLLFKIQHWPGASPMLIAGAILLTTVFLPIFTYKAFNNAETIKAGFIFICVGIFFMNVFSFMISMNLSTDVMVPIVKQGEEILKTTRFLKLKDDKLADNLIKDTLTNENINKVKSLSDELSSYIEKIKIDLIATSDGTSRGEATINAKNISGIMYKDNSEFSIFYMLGDHNDGKAYELKAKIEKYKNALLAVNGISETAKTIINKSFDIPKEISDPEGNLSSWEYNNFRYSTLISTVNMLSSIQRNIRISEGEVLESFSCKVDNNKEHASKKTDNKYANL